MSGRNSSPSRIPLSRSSSISSGFTSMPANLRTPTKSSSKRKLTDVLFSKVFNNRSTSLGVAILAIEFGPFAESKFMAQVQEYLQTSDYVQEFITKFVDDETLENLLMK